MASLGFTTAKASSILQGVITKDTYVCLSTTTPTKNGGNFKEPAQANGYLRKKFGTVNTSIGAQVANDEIIFIFEALADCGSATHLGLSDSSTIGSAVFLTAELRNPCTMDAGYVPLIRAKNLIIGLDVEVLNTAYA